MLPGTESRHKPLLVEQALHKLRDTSIVILRREVLKPPEEKRVTEALTLLETGPPPPGSTGAKRREIYLEFLQRVRKVAGTNMVVLCAVGLGPSVVSNLKDRFRLDLPYAINDEKRTLDSLILQSLTDKYSSDCQFVFNCHLRKKILTSKKWQTSVGRQRQLVCKRMLMVATSCICKVHVNL